MKRRFLPSLFLVVFCSLAQLQFAALSDPFQRNQSSASDPFQEVEQEEPMKPVDDSPIIDYRTRHLKLDLDKSVFDRPKKNNGRDGEKNDAAPPPIPIDDHLHWLALGGILLFSIALKKGWFR